MTWFCAATPAGYLELMLRERVLRARTRSDRGASAIEWVVISAILVVIAGAVGVALYNKVTTKVDSINLDTGP